MWRPAIFAAQIVVSETYFTNDSHSSAETELLHTFIHLIRAVVRKYYNVILDYKTFTCMIIVLLLRVVTHIISIVLARKGSLILFGLKKEELQRFEQDEKIKMN